jgi:peptide/nickel transport system substrate-binding protein
MKKFIFLIMLLAAALFVFAACNRGNDDPAPTPSGNQPPAQGNQPAAPGNQGGQAQVTPPAVAPTTPRDELRARAAAMVPVPGSYLVNATITRPDADILSSAWSNPSPNGQMRGLIGGLGTMARNHFNDWFPNPMVMADWPVIEDDADGNRKYTFTVYTDNFFSDGTRITAWHYGGGIGFGSSPYWIDLIPGFGVSHILDRNLFATGEIDVWGAVRVYNDTTFSITFAAEHLPNVWANSAHMSIGPTPLHMYGVEAHDNGQGVFIRAIGGGPVNQDALRNLVMGGEEVMVPMINPETGEQVVNAAGEPQYASGGSDGLRFRPTVFSGPYMFESVDVGNGILSVIPNPYFPGTWDGYRPRIERIVWRLTPSALMVDAVASGAACAAIDQADGAFIENALAVLVGGGTHTFVNYDQSGQLFTQYHCDTGPTQFVAVRQALSYLQDRHTMNELVGRGFTAVAHGPWSSAWWWYQEAANSDLYDRIRFYDLNIPRAIEILEADGWNYNADGSPFVPGVDTLRHKWVDEWEWGTDDDGNIVRVLWQEIRSEVGVNAGRSNKVYTGERVLMPLVINWMVRAVGYPFRDQLEVSFFDNVAAVGGLLIQERSDLWGNALQQGYRFAGGRYEVHTLGVSFATVWSPWVQSALGEIPSQNWAQADSLEWRELANRIRMADLNAPGGQDAFVAAFVDYMEHRTINQYTLPFNMSVNHDFIPNDLHNWFNNSTWGFSEAIMRAYRG